MLLALTMACEPQYGNLGYNLPDDCPGQCVRLPPLGFDGPALLWFGPAGEAPECPERAAARVFEGVDGVQDEPLNCPACSCSQPACVFPEGLTASSQAMCQGSTTDFSAPAPWDGSCTSPGTVPSNELGSVTIAPVTENPCEPITNVPQKGPEDQPAVTIRAVGCAGEVLDGVCPDTGYTCLPSAAPPPPGFQQCIMYNVPSDGTDVQCPADYPEQHVFYEGVADTRECTECACVQIAPSECAAAFSSYQDSACSTFLGSLLVEGGPLCSDVPAGSTLGSIEATWVTNQPGTCEASGGESVGEAKPTNPRTFCCQPPPGGGS